MKSFATLPLLATLGYAQTVTLTSTDVFGNAIATSTAEYTPGEEFMVDLDIGINSWSLKELKLNTGTYGVDQCEIMMPKGHQEGAKCMRTVGKFFDMCQWPNFVSTEMYLNVENIPQFKQVNRVAVKCLTQDVSFKKASKDLPCSGNEALIAQNNQLANPYTNFNFEPLYEGKKVWAWDTGLIYFSNFADIFLKGINPVLDLAFVGINNAVYQESFERLLMAYGHGGRNTMGGKGGMAPTQKEINWMLGEFEEFGFWTYGAETAIAAYPLINTFFSDGFETFNDMVFEFADYDESEFGNVINGGLTYKDEWWTDLDWYFRLNVLAQETMTTVYMAMYEPSAIVQWWPRHLRAIWNFYLAFYE